VPRRTIVVSGHRPAPAAKPPPAPDGLVFARPRPLNLSVRKLRADGAAGGRGRLSRRCFAAGQAGCGSVLAGAGAARSALPLSASRTISIARRAPWESSIALSATSRFDRRSGLYEPVAADRVRPVELLQPRVRAVFHALRVHHVGSVSALSMRLAKS
jgi:hypothetical protein